ncbi:Stk1 family PASTA domain-containing Ser/Thr kinase [Nonomuraea longicatena]|uniref:Stk1 family PASTA domain-containing Ser/Thr kinase n=1 Tax=Nonomuraea longicatena TaxID=83682 RepID=UPI0031E05D24
MDTTTSDPLVGRLLDGRYRIESRIAQGGMASVYLALDVRLDRTVAVKVMHRSLADDPSFVRRFIGEAKTVASLSHPNVVQVFDQGTDGDVVYLSMEYVPGKTLRDVLRERGRLPAREALELLIPVLAALGAAHQAQMVHRDVKPENVLLTADGRVKVVDFGLARAIEATNQTRTGVMIGTIGYMSPEQVTTGGADVRSDVYAAGIMLFELVTGQQPYDGETPMSVAYRHVHDTVAAPSSLVAELPQLIDGLVAHATQRDPDNRPADATAMLVAAVEAHRLVPRTTTPPASRMSHSMPGSGAHGTGEQRPSAPYGHPAPARDDVPNQTRVQPRASTEPPVAEAPRRTRWALLVAAAVVTVAAVTLVGFHVTRPVMVKVPELAGQSLEQARKRLGALRLNVEVARGKYHEQTGKGLVLSSNPAPGTEVVEETTVMLVPSLGAKRVTVPKIQGMSVTDARSTIAAAGLQIGAVRRYENLQVPRGTVLKSSPDVGERIREGARVDILVSAGMRMPDVSGMPKDEAAAYLGERGLAVTVNEIDDDAEPCTVIAQNPKARSEVDQGLPVTVTVSRCRDFWEWLSNGDTEADDDANNVMVPQVSGKTVADARNELQALGFKVKIRKLLSGDVVRYQRPAPGNERPHGSDVHLWY